MLTSYYMNVIYELVYNIVYICFNVILPGIIKCAKLTHNKYSLPETHQDAHIGH